MDFIEIDPEWIIALVLLSLGAVIGYAYSRRQWGVIATVAVAAFLVMIYRSMILS